MNAAETVRRAAPAKINLYLHVTGRRADLYHTLDGLVAFAAVHDTVTAAAAGELSLAIDGPFAAALAAEPDNLVLRAARRLAALAGVVPRARLTLEKRLPVASGLGGGSADAAAALAALARLWRLDLPARDLARLALELGADVPVCLHGRAVHVGGIGEMLSPAPHFPPSPLLLVNPMKPLPTASVFKARAGAFSSPAPLERPAASPQALAAALRARRNDLTAAATGLVPDIATVLDALTPQPGCLLARLCGSGATCFGMFESDAASSAAAAAIARAHPRWWVCPTTLIADAGSIVAA